MGTRRLSMRQLREILRLKHEQKLSHRAIARACRVGVGTVSEYVRRAARAGLEWPLPEELDEAALEARLFSSAGPGSRERVVPDVERIHQELKRVGVTLHLLWEEYREANPKGYAYSQFCVIYGRWAQKLKPSMRQVHRAGEKTFIDFSGKRPELTDPRTGTTKPVELFVAALGASGYTYAEATPSQKLADWIGVHIRMVEFFGGSSRIWVPDQLKSAITLSCRYEAGVNRTYQDEAEHYGAVVIPARPRKPKDKAKIEATVLLAQRWLLARIRNHTFFSLADLNGAIRKLLLELNQRPMQKLRVSRLELYERLDRPALQPLPTDRYEQAEWKGCRANIDYHVRTRDGSQVTKRYDIAQTPYQRLSNSDALGPEVRDRLAAIYQRSDPVDLLRQPEKLQDAFWRHAKELASPTPTDDIVRAALVSPNCGADADRALIEAELPDPDFEQRIRRQYRKTRKQRVSMAYSPGPVRRRLGGDAVMA